VQALSIYWKKRPVELGKNGKLVRGPSAKPRDAPKAVTDRNALDDILAMVHSHLLLRFMKTQGINMTS